MKQVNRTFKTPHGTELPILNLKGKDYLEVKYRLVWFREEHPLWAIQTDFVDIGKAHALVKAEVKDETGRIIATSHKNETSENFPDFLEKAETGAIGRALALIGYGTQFCADELDEGDRIVDAPSQLRQGEELKAFSVGDFRIGFGKKYLGKKLKDIPRDEIESYMDWLESSAAKQKTGLSMEARLLQDAVKRFYHTGKEEVEVEREEGDRDDLADEQAPVSGARESPL